jgi:hypothetical protein
MQYFSVESKTSGISSSSTLWQELEARYKSSNEVNMTPRSPGTKPEKMKNSEDPVRKLPNLAGQGASSNPRRNWRQGPTCRSWKTRRLGNQHRAKEVVGWAEMGPDQPAQAISKPSWPPLTYPPFRLFIASRPGATHQLICHWPPRSREERDTISERRGSS